MSSRRPAGRRWTAAQAKPGVTGRTDFATNQLVIVTPANDPAGVSSIQDLTKPGVKLVLAAVGVPVGDYAREALTNAGILDAATANVVSNEQDDASVVAKVASGDADAGIVYTSDVSTAANIGTQVRSVDIPQALNVTATYPIAVVTGATQPAAAQAFVAYVTGIERSGHAEDLRLRTAAVGIASARCAGHFPCRSPSWPCWALGSSSCPSSRW